MKTYFTLLLAFIFGSLCAQSELLIEVRDIETSEPISFATARIKDSQRGLVADFFGQFRYPISNINDAPVLVLNSLGYQPLEVDLRTLNSKIINVITLTPQIETLDAVILRVSKKNLKPILESTKRMTAYELVYKAVHSITENLPKQPHSNIGYYRDYQYFDNQYFNLNEGILEQFDSGINSLKLIDSTNQSVFYEFGNNSVFKVNPEFSKAYNGKSKFVQGAKILSFGGNELSILNVHNPIRNFDQNSFSFVYHLNKEFLQLHKFERSKVFFKDDDPLVTITFTNDHKATSYKHKVVGSIILSLRDFSIYAFNYTVNDVDKSNPIFTVKIEYQRYSDEMHLSYISFNNRFVVADNDVFKESKVTYNPSDKYFELTFNSNIDFKTVRNRSFRIEFQRNRIKIKDRQIVNDSTLRLFIDDSHGLYSNLGKEEMKYLNFMVRNLKDMTGREIYKPQVKIVYQFREYFVQEIFENKLLNTNLNFVDKMKPLRGQKLNKLEIKNSYILNTPLRSTKVD
ncbi:hypothetical protein [Winogradskyella sp. A3E31]|uniref:hypothetical protein n=1 Tax=Winogradskyella sp. A3E31 TaxID=3349637 RepID=UPI00398B2B9A